MSVDNGLRQRLKLQLQFKSRSLRLPNSTLHPFVLGWLMTSSLCSWSTSVVGSMDSKNSRP